MIGYERNVCCKASRSYDKSCITVCFFNLGNPSGRDVQARLCVKIYTCSHIFYIKYEPLNKSNGVFFSASLMLELIKASP